MISETIDVLSAPKTDAYRAVNPIDLPRIERAAVTSGSRDGIYIEQEDKPRLFERVGAAFVDDPDETGLFSGRIGPAKYLYPPTFTAAINDATLIGYRTILTPEKQFFTDEAYAEMTVFERQLNRISSPDPFANEMTGLRPTGEKRHFYFDPGDRPRRQIEGNMLVLCSDEPLSYGSFLFRVVPKIRTIRELRLTDLSCIVYAQQKPFMDLLNICGIPSEKVLLHDMNTVTKIERAIIPSMRDPHAYLDPESFELYAELRAIQGSPTTGRRLYVSRFGLNKTGRGATRVMLNEEELITRLQAMGFEVIEPENMSVRDQIIAFSSASIVIGPSGSGLFNTMFCHPGTKIIDIQSEPHWIYSYTGMYSSLKLEYGIFVGKPDPMDTRPVHRQFTVNIGALITRIRTFMAEASW